MHHMTSQTTLFAAVKPLRVTVPITPEVHAVFVRLAGSQGASVGKVMGDWLRDTAGAAEQLAVMLADVKARPLEVATRLSGYASAMSEVSTALVDRIRTESKGGRAEGVPLAGKAPRTRPAQKSAGEVLTPPVSNTGGKVSKKALKPQLNPDKNTPKPKSIRGKNAP
jgi:hypothetical protein